MPGKLPTPPITLGAYMAARRGQLDLTIVQAAHAARRSRVTWYGWENDKVKPKPENYGAIERALDWPPNTVISILAGDVPAQPHLATVTPLRPGTAHASSDAEEVGLVEEWHLMGLSEATIGELIDRYRAEKAGADTARVARYRDHARRAAGG